MIQSHVQEGMRGRVMSAYTLILFGGMPIGSLIGGTVASSYGEQAAVTLGAVGMALVAVWAWLRRPALRSLA